MIYNYTYICNCTTFFLQFHLTMNCNHIRYIKFFFQALGPTYSKIIANQFARLRKGDRFFYEDDTDENVRLLPAELREIKKTTLALIFCNNLNANNEPLGNYSSDFLISIYLL